jgi:RimJ/RimL family protein N-acetyltransferase
MSGIPANFTIATARCILRAMDEADAPFIAASLRDGGFADAMRWDLPREESALLEVVRASRAKWQAGSGYRFTIELLATREPLGGIALRHEPRVRDWSMGFWIARAHWGRGYAVEVARAMMEFAFSNLHATTVRAAHAGRNRQSRRVIEKLGMRFNRQIADGLGHDEAVSEFEYAVERR